MNVKVERCVGKKFRLSRGGKQLMILGDEHGDWTRAIASKAKTLIKYEWGIDPEKVRFVW